MITELTDGLTYDTKQLLCIKSNLFASRVPVEGFLDGKVETGEKRSGWHLRSY